MARTGFLDHIGIRVPDLVAATRCSAELMPILGSCAWFPNGDGIAFLEGELRDEGGAVLA